MKIIIDEREAMLYELCVSMNQTLNMPIEKRVLELGDILFMSDDESIVHLIIERKSFADLLSSIKDGRYAEQSHRLRNCFPNPHNVVYLLEGMFSTVKNKENKEGRKEAQKYQKVPLRTNQKLPNSLYYIGSQFAFIHS